MPLTLRPGRPEDATMCGTICYEGLQDHCEQHNFPASYPSPEVAIERMVERLTHPGLYAVVAELDGSVVGSNFLDDRSAIAGLAQLRLLPPCKIARLVGTSCRTCSNALPPGTIWGYGLCRRPIMPAR